MGYTSAVTLDKRRIVVGIGGGIAAFKAVEIVRELGRRGAEVRVAMTESASLFVGPVTFAGLTGRPAVLDLWDPSYAGEVHVELGAFADAMIVAPATMNLLARAAAGLADDVVLATYACARAPVFFAPAMHTRMWEQPSTQRNLAFLRAAGAHVVGPVAGALASGEIGMGRMAEPVDIVDAVEARFEQVRDLAGRRILVTAGPTVEDLDPVRFLGNRSSGRMGYAIAERAARRGAEVLLVSGPVTLPRPPGVEVIEVRSALEMHAAVLSRQTNVDAIVMAAAVADYRPVERATSKQKKSDGPITIELTRNPDILRELGASRTGNRPVLVGFAVETDDLLRYARGKLEAKNCDLIVANEARVGFGGEDNQVVLVGPEGDEALPPMSKAEVGDRILDRVSTLLSA